MIGMNTYWSDRDVGFRVSLYEDVDLSADGDVSESESGDPVIVDVVDPLWTAENVVTTLDEATGQFTTTMDLLGTDKYYNGSTLTKDSISVLKDGTAQTAEITLTGPTAITGTVDGSTATIGSKYSLTIAGTANVGDVLTLNITQGKLTDKYGNSNKATDFTLDFTTAATGSIAMKKGSVNGEDYTNKTWTNQDVYLYANASSKANTTTKYSVDGGTAKASGSANYTQLTEGTYTVTLTTVDSANSTTTNIVYTYTVKIDKILPEISIDDDLSDGLIRNFNAQNNTTSGHSSSTTTWADLSGNNNGTLTGGTWSDNYLTLDGTDDWVNLGQVSLTNAVTLEATVEIKSIKSDESMMILSNQQNGGVTLYVNKDGYIRMGVYDVEISDYNYTTNTTKLNIGQKYHILGIWDGISQKIYLDGELVANDAYNGTYKNPTTGTPIAIGADPTSSSASGNFANMNIYSAKVYNRALTDAEVTRIKTGLVREYNGINNTGDGHSSSATTWTDLTGSYNGKLTGGTWTDGYLALDGVDDWVNLGQVNITDAVTLEATIEMNSINESAEMHILSNVNTGGVDIVVNTEGKFVFAVYDSTSASYVNVNSGVTPVVGQKYHIVGTFDGTSLKIYINGELKATQKFSGTYGAPNKNTVMVIGANPTASTVPGNYANINVYSAKIYTKARTQEQIMEDYESSIVYPQSHDVTITLSDELSGIATGAQVQYAWSTSNTEEPTEWASLNITGNPEGVSRATATITQDGLNGKYYLWIKSGTVQDVAGNTNTTTVVSNIQYWFDNEGPTITIYGDEYYDNDGTNLKNGLIRNFNAQNNTTSGHSSSTTTWTDLSGNNNGTLTGGTWTDGYLALDGTDDWVNLGQVSLTDAVTLETTIQLNAIQSGTKAILSNFETGGVGIEVVSGIPKFQIYLQEQSSYVIASSDTALTVGKKYHILGLYDGTSVKLYINGELEAETACSGTIGTPESSTVMAIGANPIGTSVSGSYANINVYSAKVYDRALTEEELESITSGLVRKFNAVNNTESGHSNSTTTWTDWAGNYDGVLTGGVWSKEYLSLDGVDDWVNLGQVLIDDQVTLEATIEIDEIQSGSAYILSNIDSGGVYIYLSNGIPRMGVYNASSAAYVITPAAGSALTPGQKHHIVGTFDGTSIKVYVDGVLTTETAFTGTYGTPKNSTVMAIGVNPHGYGTDNEGLAKMKVYSAKIYTKALTAEQVMENYIPSTTWEKTHEATIKLSDVENGLATGTQVQYGWSTSNTTEPETWTDLSFTGYSTGVPATATPITQGELTGKYYLWVKPVGTEYVQDSLGNTTTTAVVSDIEFWFDNESPTWSTTNLNIDVENNIVTVDLVASDSKSGYASDSLDASDITVYVDGDIAEITKELSEATAIEDGGVKYTLTLTNWTEAARQSGKLYKEWSGQTNIVIAKETATDQAGNKSEEQELNLGHIDVIDPEFTYEYSEADIDYQNKTVKVVFSVTDEYFSESTLTIDDLKVFVDGEEPEWATAEEAATAGNTKPVKEFTSVTDITATVNGTEKVIGKKYTLLLSNLEQSEIAEGKNYLDYSGVVTVIIPEGKIKDTSENTNLAQTITVGTNVQYESTKYEPTYIPEGYEHVAGTTMENGYVVEDSKGNQYVWVEVPQTATVYANAGVNITSFTDNEYTAIEEDLLAYAETYDQCISSTAVFSDDYYDGCGLTEYEYNIQKKKMLKSVYLNGGFYVGRYETGIDPREGARYSEDDPIADYNPIIQQNAYPYTYVTASQAQEVSKTFASGTEGYISSLMYGVQWDVMMKYLETKGLAEAEMTTDSINWGNYANSIYTITADSEAQYRYYETTEWIQGTLFERTSETTATTLTTGALEKFSKQNIYDLAGNVAEWTLENSNKTNPCTTRGGSYGYDSTTRPAAIHAYSATTNSNASNGFRVALYKDEGTGTVSEEKQPTYIPKGYTHVEGTTMENGYVVKDGIGNEYVWVEVPRTAKVYATSGLNITEFTEAEYTSIEYDLQTYTSVYRNGTAYTDEYFSDETTGLTEEEYNTQKKKMLKSIYKNGGFYVGRYETGIASSYRTEASTTLQTPVIKQNAYPYNNVTTSQAQTLSTQFAPAGYTSSLMFGVQWDLILKYLETKGATQDKLMTDSVSWGNYKDNLWNITNTNAKYYYSYVWYDGAYGEKTSEMVIGLSTGASDSFSKQNIYDLAGNQYEWTLEYSSNTSVPTTARGGIFNNTGATNPAGKRSSGATTTASNGISFRTALYKDEGTLADQDTDSTIVDVVDPLWTTENLNIDYTRQKVTLDIKVTDKYLDAANSGLTAEDITIYVDGTEVPSTATLTKRLSDPTPLTEMRTVDGVDTEVQYGIKYTLELSNWKEIARDGEKLYKEWSGDTKLVIATDAAKDQSGNSNKEQEIELGHIDVIRPEFTYVYAGTSRDENASENPEIDYTNKKLTVVFSVADKYFDSTKSAEESLTVEDLTVLIDGVQPTWRTEGGTTGVTRTLTSEAITESRTNSEGTTENYTVGYKYTLELTNLEQDPNNGFDYSGVVTIVIPAEKFVDTSDNTNYAQSITVGIDGTEESPDYTTPYLPEGFRYVEGGLSSGIVIADSLGNEYVWVEVPRTTDVYSESTLALDLDSLSGTSLTNALDAIEEDLISYSSNYAGNVGKDTYYSDDTTGLTKTEYNELKNKMLKSVFENGGFYIGRYETGTTTARSAAEDQLTTPVIKKNVYPYNFVTTVQAQEMAETFATDGYETSLPFGTQWALVLKYLETKGTSTSAITSNSTAWGNHIETSITITNTNAQYTANYSTWIPITSSYTKAGNDGKLLTTGASETFKKQNIYDLAGNLKEWVLAGQNVSGWNAVLRGGDFAYAAQPASMESTIGNGSSYGNLGFRVALYLDGGSAVKLPTEEPTDPEIVDVVDPVWELGDIDLGAGTVELTVKDKYFNESTLAEENLTIYVNGIESEVTQPTISSSEDILETVSGVENTLVGKKYTIQLSNLDLTYDSYIEFTPTNLETDSLDNTAGFKYKNESGGLLSIKVAEGTSTDTSGNASQEETFELGRTDITKPEVYEVQKIQDAENNTETIIFNVSDRNYDSSDLIQINVDEDGDEVVDYSEITLYIDDVQMDELLENATLTSKEIWGVPEGATEAIILGHQYTLVVSNIAESEEQEGKDYLEWSGTLRVQIAENAAKDLSGNTLNPDTTTITDFVDYIKPKIEEIEVADPINEEDQTYTMSFSIIDKYLAEPVDEDTTEDIDDYRPDIVSEDEITIFVDGEFASSVVKPTEEVVSEDSIWKKLTATPITATMNKTIVADDGTCSVVNGTYTIGYTYTLVLSNFEQTLRQSGKSFKEWSGTISVEVDETAVADTKGNTLGAETANRTINGEHFDFIKPEFTYESANTIIGNGNNGNTKTVTIVFDVIDKYFDSTDLDEDTFANLITVEVDDEDMNGIITKSLQKKTLGEEVTDEEGEVTYKTNGDIYCIVNGESVKIGERYELEISNLEQRNENGITDGYTYSGPMSISFPSGIITDTSSNENDATTITIGIDETDGNPNTEPPVDEEGEQPIVDVVDPVWELDEVDMDTGIVKIIAKDKYFDTCTLDVDKITIYAKGEIAEGIGKEIIDVQEIYETTGDEIRLIGNEITLQLTDIVEDDGTGDESVDSLTGGYTEFEPTNKAELNQTIPFEYRTENGGMLVLELAEGTITDTSGNTSDVQEFSIGDLDNKKPELYEVQKIQNTENNTETIIFNVTDKHYDSSDLVTINVDKDGDGVVDPEISLWIDDIQVNSLIENATLTSKVIEVVGEDAEGNRTTTIYGHQYTLVIPNIAETMRQDGKDYLEYSGTLRIEVAEEASKDTKGNTINSETTSISDFVDFINPDLQYTHQSTDINAGANEYTMTFVVTDKYYTSGELDIDDLTILIQNGQYEREENGDYKLDGDGKKIPIVYNLKEEPVTISLTSSEMTAIMNKTIFDDDGTSTIENGEYTIGHKYTLTISGLEQLDIKEGLTTLDYSGIITVSVASEQIADTTGNKNDSTTITSGINFEGGGSSGTATEVDVVSPIWERVSSSISIDATGATASTATLKFRGTDTYFDANSLTSDNIDDVIKIFANGSEITDDSITITLLSTTELTEDRIVNGANTTVQYGIEYEIKITGPFTGVNQVKIRIPEGVLVDSSANISEETDIILYNVLKPAAGESEPTSSFLGESVETTIYPENVVSVTPIQRQYIEKVEFVNSISGSLAGGVQRVWDVSAIEDESILAWTSDTEAPYTVYIGSEGAIYANQTSSYLFSYIGYASSCTEADTISNLDLLNTGYVTDMAYMFQYCGYNAMTSFDLGSDFDTSNVTNMDYMFAYCGYKAMTSFDLGDQFDTSKVTTMASMFEGYGYTKLQTLDLTATGVTFNTSNVTNMNSMFKHCGHEAMISLKLGTSFNTSNVTDMSYMFNECGYKAMTGLDLSAGTSTANTTQFNTSSVTDMSYMFDSCGYTVMTTFSLGNNFDTSNVTNMRSMFASFGYTAMASLNLGNKFNPSNVTNMNAMFKYCGYKEMISLDLGDNFDTSKVRNMGSMFEYTGFTKMPSLELGNKFYTTKVTNMKAMFQYCGATAMTVLDLGPAFTKVSYEHENFVTGCGTSSIIIYTPEAIYSSITEFKQNEIY